MEGNYDWKIVLVNGDNIAVWKEDEALTDHAVLGSANAGIVEYDSACIEIRWKKDGMRTTIPWSSVIRLDERKSVQEGRRAR